MTFWQFVDQVPDADPDMTSRIVQTARLHSVLRDYGGALGFWTPFGTYIPEGLTALERLPELISTADLDRARREWAVIEPVLTSRSAFEAAYPDADVQPIHGDAPYHNMITTPVGELWSDFELVTLGAVESDLAMVPAGDLAAYDVAAGGLGRRTLDARISVVTEAAAKLAVVSALAMAPELPLLIDGVGPVVDQWRATAPLTKL